MNRYPLKLQYHTKTALWGGETLKEKWGKKCDTAKLAETWELTVRPDAVSIIENGDASGMTLADYLTSTPDAIGYYAGNGFPLLIKLIDAADKLSIQVHPGDAYASANEKDSGKTEMWYILEASPDASIIYGLADYMDASDFCACLKNGEVEKALKKIPVHAGECYFIPAGMVHAIGKGCLIAEIQQNSDLTYRIYDYDRKDADGKPRELHVDKAMDVVAALSKEEVEGLRFSRFPRINAGICLACCPYFEVHVISLRGYSEELTATDKSFHSLLCTEGNGFILYEGNRYPICRGDSYFIPAGTGKYTLCGNAKVILSSL